MLKLKNAALPVDEKELLGILSYCWFTTEMGIAELVTLPCLGNNLKRI